MKIILKKSDYEQIVAYAKSQLPYEACGLIAGREVDGNRVVEKVYFLTNVDASNEHFTMDPKEQLATIKDVRSLKLELFGNWHSHPESPSRPSDEDKRLSYDSNASYLILSLMDLDNPVLNSFHVENRQDVTREILEII
ncbi:MAG: M67 family metallopeptidase [Succinivibrionaceae bacterium]|jgi:proteasome lid subunit RPN8/RPN11|nr:M67 family metallopeptidase [Succinivibrionaceae bacterium]